MTTVSHSDHSLQFASEGFILHGRYWLPTSSQSVGVVCCHALGEEKKSTHRSLVGLAKNLASQGFPVLLFDYAGCGDSTGDDADGNLYRWQHNIEDAIQQLIARSRVERIVLVGIRIGGWLALETASHSPLCQAVVLWSPLLDLREYARSLRLQQRTIEITLGFARNTLHRSEAGIDMGGIFLSATLLEEMQTTILPKGEMLRVLYLETGPQSHLSSEAQEAVRHLQIANYQVEAEIINDSPLRAQTFSYERPALVARTSGWIGEFYADSCQIQPSGV